MNRLNLLIPLVVVLMLGACASSGPDYQPARNAGQPGYTEQQISANRYVVTFVAKESEAADARDLSLLRAAELTLQKGGDWFEVASREQRTDKAQHHTQVSTSWTRGQTESYTRCGLLNCSTSTYTRPSTVVEHHQPPARGRAVATVEFVIGQGNVPQGAAYYDAAEVVDTLRDELLGS